MQMDSTPQPQTPKPEGIPKWLIAIIVIGVAIVVLPFVGVIAILGVQSTMTSKTQSALPTPTATPIFAGAPDANPTSNADNRIFVGLQDNGMPTNQAVYVRENGVQTWSASHVVGAITNAPCWAGETEAPKCTDARGSTDIQVLCNSNYFDNSTGRCA